MALKLKPRKLCNSFYMISRSYCDKEDKSIYQRLEEGPKGRTVYGKSYPEWRKPWIQRDGEWTTKLSLFVEKNPSAEILSAMSKIPDLTFKKVKDWWIHMKEVQEIHNQKFLPKRVSILGSNLAALHFFTHRQCSVRLKDSQEWIAGDLATLDLPPQYIEGYFVEAIDCSKFHHNGIRYEGLQNLSGLQFLRWLSLKNNKYVDVWGLDRIAGQNGKSLEYLDISGCNLCVGGVFALARMQALKILIITDPGDNDELQAALSMLEHECPTLLINALKPETIKSE